ncbi:MAG: polyprenyl synthetase family protein [Bdellovibrionales bacterium]|nr:polyprenyl synthetase family protein [Bdellovibrionales bacterium]
MGRKKNKTPNYKASSEGLFKDKEIQVFLDQFKVFLKKHTDRFLPLGFENTGFKGGAARSKEPTRGGKIIPDGDSCLPFRGHQQLRNAIEYSLFSGGKHFRPLLILATARLMKIKVPLILPWATAIEMIHAASLIHDDLPCMDNSAQRRGKASCHRQFGEDIALLAGDCLWIEAFHLIHVHTKENKHKLKWLFLLCQAAGFQGLMGGQALDLRPPLNPDEFYYKKMHFMKTGTLISTCIEGVLALRDKSTEKTKKLKTAAPLIGRAFQISDDLQDKSEKITSNLSCTLGRKKAYQQLNTLSNKALQLIDFAPSFSLFKKLIIFNQKRAFAEN